MAGGPLSCFAMVEKMMGDAKSRDGAACCAELKAQANEGSARELHRKVDDEEHVDSGDETTPTTTVSECSESGRDDGHDDLTPFAFEDGGAALPDPSTDARDEAVPQLGPGLFPPDIAEEFAQVERMAAAAVSAARAMVEEAAALMPSTASCRTPESPELPLDLGSGAGGATSSMPFNMQETLYVFDWDDTILPSSWLQRRGLRLDGCCVPSAADLAQLGEVAEAAAETLRIAKRLGTVVLLTNAERGWIELSCQKFVPALLPIIENIKVVSARTTYESRHCQSPLTWKVRAFEAEIGRACGVRTLADPEKRKNIHSLGDSVHEREALMRATASLPNCYTKSVKFVERPDLSDLLRQHRCIAARFEKITQHEGDLDLCINAP